MTVFWLNGHRKRLVTRGQLIYIIGTVPSATDALDTTLNYFCQFLNNI